MKSNFYRKILSNGMTLLFEKRNLPLVSVAFAVRQGGVNEFLEEKGISHFIEHMLYKGTSFRSAKKIAEDIEKNGGDLNGFTSEEVTAYWCKMPSKYLNIALDVLSDMVKNSLFDEDELEKERKVIFEEIKMCHDIPMRYVFDEIGNLIYNKNALNIIGTYKTMNLINREKIVKKFKQVYKPNNMILCVVGDADFEEIVKFAEENFESEQGEIIEQDFELIFGEKIETRKGIDQANLVFAYHVGLANDSKNYSAQVLSCLMAEGMSSRLFQEIREKRNLAYAIKGGSEINKRFAYNFIYVGTMKENLEKIKKLILEEFEKVAESLNEEELNQIKKQMIGNYYISMEDSQTQMVNLILSEVHGNANDFYNFEKNISKIKLKDVKELAKNVKKGYSFFGLIPENVD
jgi:predicted Zn-dependent peptidase